jgi:hypothetical protein
LERIKYHKLLKACFEELIVDPYASWMLNWRKRVLDDIFHITIHVYLLQGNPHRARLCIREHDKLGVGGCLVVVELIL